METVLFLTASYPYLPGEQFIEDEISYWSSLPDIRVILVPMAAQGYSRQIPKDILIDLSLANSWTTYCKLKYFINALGSPIFLKEIAEIRKAKKSFIGSALVALKTTATVMHSTDRLRLICNKWGNINTAYCYWNSAQAYASVILKKEMLIDRVVSRAHGLDLYEDRHKHGYMPLKRQFINYFDSLLAISKQGAKYAQVTYGIDHDKVLLSRLGVPLPDEICQPSAKETIKIISVSFCVKVKRLDKVILALKMVAELRKEIEFRWVHIGGGPLFYDLKKLAESNLAISNISFEFSGMLSNSEVRNYFHSHEVDIFINSSESEGVPVSIMEAMSYGVPVIAPNVGGISEIVDENCGKLLSTNPSEVEIAEGIISIMNSCKDTKFRSRAKKKIIDYYNADSNYRELVAHLFQESKL